MLLAVEHGPAHRRGLFGSIPQVGLALGLALGTGVFALLQATLSDAAFLAYGWRIAFLLSIGLVVFGVVVRLRATETPVFERVRENDERVSMPVREVFRPPVLRSTVLGLLSRWGEGAAFNTWGVFAIAYATTTLKLDKVWGPCTEFAEFGCIGPIFRQTGHPAARSFMPTRSTTDVGTAQHLGADPHDCPPDGFEQCAPVDVPGPLPGIGPVLHPVVLHRDSPCAPTHIDGDTKIRERDLGLGPGQSAADEN